MVGTLVCMHSQRWRCTHLCAMAVVWVECNASLQPLIVYSNIADMGSILPPVRQVLDLVSRFDCCVRHNTAIQCGMSRLCFCGDVHGPCRCAMLQKLLKRRGLTRKIMTSSGQLPFCSWSWLGSAQFWPVVATMMNRLTTQPAYICSELQLHFGRS